MCITSEFVFAPVVCMYKTSDTKNTKFLDHTLKRGMKTNIVHTIPCDRVEILPPVTATDP